MENSQKKSQAISILGLGYVGLTLAATFAEEGFLVYGIDNNPRVIEGLKRGVPHFHEPGLEEMLARNSERLEYHTRLPSDKKSSVYIISVGTNIDENGAPDYSHVDQASRDIGEVLKKGDVVILRSTVVMGATRARVLPQLQSISGLRAGKDFFVAFAPERTIEGKALEELRTLPQIIAGFSAECAMKSAELFRSITKHIVLLHTLEEAELVKLSSNAYRDLTFAFANNLALVAAEHNLDINSVIAAANEGYSRNNIPLPSPGVGGYCLTKDPHLLAYSAGSRSELSQLLREGRRVNKHMPSHVADIIEQFTKINGGEKNRIAILGLAFKGEPQTSDVRFSPSETLITILRKRGFQNVIGYDTHVHDGVFEGWNIERANSFDDVTENADVAVFMHRHDHYRTFDPSLFGDRHGAQLIVDPWALFRKEDVVRVKGLEYANLGFRSFHDNNYE